MRQNRRMAKIACGTSNRNPARKLAGLFCSMRSIRKGTRKNDEFLLEVPLNGQILIDKRLNSHESEKYSTNRSFLVILDHFQAKSSKNAVLCTKTNI